VKHRFALLGLAVLVAMSSGCGDAPSPAEPSAGGGAGADGGGVAFCAALQVLRDKCQRCHSDPPVNGAPAPFLTYADTQAEYFDTGLPWWQVMQHAVQDDFMPPTALNADPSPIEPPVEPLNDQERATLLGWLEEGARATGGTSCP
jgi:uncharacterized membrane protein